MAPNDPCRIREEEKTFFDENGYVVIRGFFSTDEIAPLRAAYDALVQEAEEEAAGRKRGQLIQRSGLATAQESWRDQPYLQAIVQAGRALLGDDIDFWYDQIIMKPAGNPGSTPWHQDAGYWAANTPRARLANGRGITCWLALSEVTAQHGCMQFIPGSHRGGVVDHVSAAHRSVINGAREAVGVDDRHAVRITMHPGDLSFHHSRTLHYTTGNEADTPRCGLVTHLAPRVTADAASVDTGAG